MAAYPGPDIIIYDDIQIFMPDFPDLGGLTYSYPPLIIMTDKGLKNDNLIVLQHEMVHYIFIMNGMPYNDNKNHSSYLFEHCGDRTY